MERGFESGTLPEDDKGNSDETHFVFNMGNGKTLALIGDKDVKYTYVFSCGERITMMVWLAVGEMLDGLQHLECLACRAKGNQKEVLSETCIGHVYYLSTIGRHIWKTKQQMLSFKTLRLRA